MKIKNLLLVPLLGVALVATSACNNGGDSSSSEPTSSSSEPQQKVVSRVKVEKVSNAVVGDTLDFDTLVTVYYDDDTTSKDYTLEAPASSKNKIKIDGHKVTFKEEGEITINVKAGEQSAKFQTEVFTKLKKAFRETMLGLGDTWAAYEIDEDSKLALATVHRSDYTWFNEWDEDADENVLGGGFLRASNGLTYQYTTPLDRSAIDVDGEIMPYDFDSYYCDNPWLLSIVDFESRENELGEEELFMSGDVPAEWGIDSCPNRLAEFAYTNARVLESSYVYVGLVVSPFEFERADTSKVSTFRLDMQVAKKTNKSKVVATQSLVLEPSVSESEVTIVRNYIDDGHYPEPVHFEEAPAKIKEIATAKAYTVNVTAGWYNPSTGVAIDKPATTGYWLDYIVQYSSVGTEVDYVNATEVVQQATIGGKEVVYGDIYNEAQGGLFTFSNVEESAVIDTIKATKVEGTDVWVDRVVDTIGAMDKESLWSDFVALSREENDDGSITIGTNGKNCNVELISSFLYSTYLGYGFAYIGEGLELTPASGGESFPAIEYYDLYFTVSATSLTIEAELVWNSSISYNVTATYSAIGEDHVPALDIQYPSALA